MINTMFDNENEKLKFEIGYLKTELERYKKNNATMLQELCNNKTKNKLNNSDFLLEYSKNVKQEINFDNTLEMEIIKDEDLNKHTNQISPVNNKIPFKKPTQTKRNEKKHYNVILIPVFVVILIIGFVASAVLAINTSTRDMSNDTKKTDTIKITSSVVEQDLKQAYSQITQLQQEISSIEDKNVNLESKVKVFETKILELSKKRNELYYPMKVSNSNSFDYIKTVVDNWQYLGPYEENKYDCSQMAAHLQWFLEANGIKAQIVEGKPNWSKNTHAWVFAYGNFGKVAIETTNKKIIYESGFHLFSTIDESYYNDKNITNIYNSVFTIPTEKLSEYEWWDYSRENTN